MRYRRAGIWGLRSAFGGTADLHSQRHYCLPEHHEIFVVGNAEEAGKKVGSAKVGLNWHTDHYHLPEPGLFTFLHAVQVPKVAGDTRYANGMAAFDALPGEIRARIDGLEVLHSRARLFRELFPEASEADMEAERRRRCRMWCIRWCGCIRSWGGAGCIWVGSGGRRSRGWGKRRRMGCSSSCSTT